LSAIGTGGIFVPHRTVVIILEAAEARDFVLEATIFMLLTMGMCMVAICSAFHPDRWSADIRNLVCHTEPMLRLMM
jgi:hypothetical protein